MKRPFLIVAWAFAGGIWLGASSFQPPRTVLFGLAFLLLLLALGMARFRVWFLIPLLALAGWIDFAVGTDLLSPLDLRTLTGGEMQLATIRGRLVESPKERLYLHDSQETWRTHAVIEVETLIRGEDSSPAIGRVVVTTPNLLGEEFFAGRRVEIAGVLRQPSGPAADGLFDYRGYLRWQGIYYQLRASSPKDWALVDDPTGPKSPPLIERFFHHARRSIAAGLPEEDQPLRLLWAMTLDWHAAFTEDLAEPFIRAGTYHIFAVDGLRIGVIAGVLLVILRVFRAPRVVCGLVVIPLVWLYVAGTGWPASAIRAAIMLTVVVLGWMVNRPGDTVNSLFAAAFIILAWQPLQLFQAGFQLSFGVVLCILLLMPVFEDWRGRFLRYDPLLPEELLSRAQRWRVRVGSFVAEWTLLSAAAWLGSVPLTAYYFHLFSLASIPANTVAVPLSVLALAANLGSLLVESWLPGVAGLFNHASWLIMKLIWWISEWMANLPGGYFYVAAPAWLTIAAYYAVLLAILTGWVFAPTHRRWRVGGLAAVVLVWGSAWLLAAHPTRLDILKESGGILIQTRRPNEAMLVDCGNEKVANSLTKPFLRAQGINRLPGLLLTHADIRHVGGTMLVATNFSVQQIIASPARARSPAYRELHETFKAGQNRWHEVRRGGTVGVWQVLHPDDGDKFTQADDNAIVLRGRFEGVTILLLSDLGRLGQRALLEREPDLHADIVIAGMPNQGEPLGEALLEAIRPRVIIVQDSEYPAKAKAGRALEDRLEQRAVVTIYVSDSGSLTIELLDRKWRVRTADGEVINAGGP